MKALSVFDTLLTRFPEDKDVLSRKVFYKHKWLFIYIGCAVVSNGQN
jgi:hypothetical protein